MSYAMLSPYWAAIYAESNTGVFWDVEDFPIPVDVDPYDFHHKIKDALEDSRYLGGPVSIWLYGYKNSLPSKDKYRASGVEINILPEGVGYGIIDKMSLDINMWALGNDKSSNLMILSKKVKEEKTIGFLKAMHSKCYNVLLTEPPPELDLPTQSPDWLWLYISGRYVLTPKQPRPRKPNSRIKYIGSSSQL